MATDFPPEPVDLKPLKSNFLPLPQTAADLLEGLLRSQLFAESIFGQIFEQSKPYLTYPAAEYAAALVRRRVLTTWQTGELLAGRTSFYWGPYRLLGKLVTGSESSLFVAEQPGAQRLVLLEAIPLNQHLGWPIHRASSHSADCRSTSADSRHPHVARCVQVRTTASHHLVAYEFIEAAWLPDVVSKQPPTKSHIAHLVLQLANTLAALRRETIEKFDPRRAMINVEGQLKWLPGPQAPFGNPTGEGSTESGRVKSQMLAILKFAHWLGGLPGITRCRNLGEVRHLLGPIAKAWRESYRVESIPGTRAVLHRMLRKGPSLKQIENLHAHRQYAFSSAPALSPTSETTNSRSRVIEPGVASTTATRQSQPFTQQAKARTGTLPQTRGRSRQLLLTAVIGAVASGLMAMQWMWQWSVPEAKAQTETKTDSAKSSDRSR